MLANERRAVAKVRHFDGRVYCADWTAPEFLNAVKNGWVRQIEPEKHRRSAKIAFADGRQRTGDMQSSWLYFHICHGTPFAHAVAKRMKALARDD